MPFDIDLQLLRTVTGSDYEQTTGCQMTQNLFSDGGKSCNNCHNQTLLDYAVQSE